jgi:23S rRNA pseudouridine2605 synthase
VAGGLIEHAGALRHPTALGIGGGEHEPADASVANGARAHGARLQRDVKPEPRQAVVAARLRRGANRSDLRMGGRVLKADGGVAARGDHLAKTIPRGRIKHHCTHRRLAIFGGGLRGGKGEAHCGKIMVAHKSHPNRRADEGQSSVPASSPISKGGSLVDAENGATIGERVAKALARAGVASRREVERLIAEGRVALNGEVLTTPAVKVGPKDILTVNGEVVSDAEPTRLWRYHKPAGLVTTHTDPKGRATVFENLPEGLPRVISVGRLDLSSEGLLLLTNDGGLTRALELPSTGLMRRYRARAYGQTTQAKLDKLMGGVTVEGVSYGPIEAHLDKAQHRAADPDKKGPANLWITITLTEGKNREVRRVLESIGLKVNRLIRLAYGPFALGALGVGEAEEVGPRVIRELLSEHIALENLPKGDRTAMAPLAASSPDGGKRAAARRDPKLNREGRPARAAAASASAEPAKPLYKTGWAKPKKRPEIAQGKRPTRPAGAKAKPGKVAAETLRGARTRPDKPPQTPAAKTAPRSGAKPYRATVKGPRPPKRPTGGPRR